MSAESVLQALATVANTGTIVQNVVIEGSLSTLTGQFPAIILFCPRTTEERVGTGKRRELHDVVIMYLDQWQGNARTAEQLAADARTALEAMKGNIRANHTLTVAGTPNALVAGERIETARLGILEQIEGQTLPFPMYVAVMTLPEIADLWFTG